jgi:peptidoglycan/LPS O-acetylase OafA/YrhL
LRVFAFFFYSLVLSLLSYRLIERPALYLRARWYAERQPTALPFDQNKWLLGALGISAVLTLAAWVMLHV